MKSSRSTTSLPAPVAASSPFGSGRTTKGSSSKLFAPSKPSHLSQNITTNGSSSQDEDDTSNDGEKTGVEPEMLHLEPPVWSKQDKGKWKASGETVGIAVSPYGGEIASWCTRKVRPEFQNCQSRSSEGSCIVQDPSQARSGSHQAPHNQIYFAAPSVHSKPLLAFYRDTYTLFTSLQRIVSSGMTLTRLRGDVEGESWESQVGGRKVPSDILGVPSAETIGHMGRLAGLYIGEIQKLRESPELDVSTAVQLCSPQVKSLMSPCSQMIELDIALCITSFTWLKFCIYPGMGGARDCLEKSFWIGSTTWIQVCSLTKAMGIPGLRYSSAPDNRQGNEIMQSRPPWDHPSFWPYLSQCILRGFHLPASSFLRTSTLR